MVKYCICTFIFFTNVFFAFSQESKKDTLFITIKNCNSCLVKFLKPIYFTDDFYGEYEIKRDTINNRFLGVNLKKERFIFSNDLLKNKDLSKYQIGVETRKCFNTPWSGLSELKCDIDYGNSMLVFYHISVSNDFLEDYIKYSKKREKLLGGGVTDNPHNGNHPLWVFEKPSGSFVGIIKDIEKKYAIYEIDNVKKKIDEIEKDLIKMLTKYSTIYFESEKIENQILFQEVNYQYYSDDVFP